MNRPTTAAELRRNAEERLRTKKAETHPPRTEEATRRLVHELEVHQIELEMQNAELRQARDDVEKSLNRYTDLYDFAPVGYVTLDRSGDISAVNLAGASLIGGARSLLIGRRFGQFVAVPGRPALTEFLRSARASQIKNSCEATLLNDAGQPVVVQIEAMATTSGQELRIALIDITKRKHAEEALAVKQQELEELNGSLEIRIAQDVYDLRQKDQMLILQDRRAVMGEMINNIAHQWRQPLNVLGLYLQGLSMAFDSAELDKEHLEKSVCKSMDLIMNMSRTIGDFMNFFRSDKEKVSFSVNQEIGRTLSLIRENFLSQKVSIDLLTEGTPMINGFPNEYSQVLMNILMNARDELALNNVKDAMISIHAFAEGDSTVVTITDNSGGIDDEIIEKIFDPYFTTKGPDKGTGIGLFMSKTIIEKNMGGRLTVRNSASGAEFRIEI
ncbi:MAG: PAS domain-containing sensor histidine kinase [Desulfuromonadaceae bacterium]|nr:PAS domain-containing sensor histidine kinase [Desulfuromonadaceae bacterium]